jgi:preprotein translocase subunit YajC
MLMNFATALAEAGQDVSVNDQATAATPAAGGAGDMLSMVLMMVVMVAVFYFMLIRPQRKKDKAVKNMLDNLKVGDRIWTIGGFYGTVAAIKDDTVTLTMGSLQNTIVIARWAIRSVENVALENDAEPQI